MSPNERRERRGFLRALGVGLSEVPYRIAELLPGRGKGGRRSERKWTRPKRIAVGLTVVVVLAAAGVTATLVARGRDPQRELWRRLDKAADDFNAGRFAEAADAYRTVVRDNPTHGIAHLNFGLSLLRLGRREEGIAEVRNAVLLQRDLPDAHLVLAEDAIARGDDDEALEELRLVVADPPPRGAAEASLAAILRRRGRDAEALRHLEVASGDLAADPLVRVRAGIERGRIHGLRATVSLVASRERSEELRAYADARKVADEAIAQTERSGAAAQLHAARAELLVAAGLPREALVDADVAIGATTDPVERAALRLLRAQIYSIAGDKAAADAELAEALGSGGTPPAAAFRGAAAIHAARGELDRALEILGKGADAHPDDAETGLERAFLRFQTGDLDAAEAECARVAAADPRGTAALVLLGDVRRARDDLRGAREAYGRAVARRPNDAEARLRLAGTAFAESGEKSADSAGQLEESERIAREILAVTPDDAGAQLALAKVRLARSPGRDAPRRPDAVNAEARELLLVSVRGDPLSYEARTFLGYALWLTRESQEAASQLTQVLSALPGERPRLRLLLARCLAEGGDFRGAADAAKRACAALPDDVEAWTLRADACHASGDREAALEALRRLEAIEPGELQHVFREAAVLAESGRFAEAEERFAAAEAKTREIADDGARASAEMDVASARAEFYRMRGDIERARSTFASLVDKGPPDAAAYVRYARFLLRLGRDADAEQQVQRGLAAEPASVEARRLLCDIWFGRGEAPAALVNAQVLEIERIVPKDPVLDYLRGKLAALAGDLLVAGKLLTQYADARPDDPDGQYALGVTLAKAGDHANAVRRLQAAGALLPGSPDVRIALAKTQQAWAVDMMRRGRLVEAQATLQRVVSDDPSDRAARALLIDSSRALGDVELSEKEVRALLRTDPSDRGALRMFAALAVGARRLDDAVGALKRLTAAAPDDWTAWQFLSAVLADKGDLDGAEVAAKASRNAAPDAPGSLAPLLHVLVLRGDAAGARREIAAATARSPDEAQYPYFLAMLCEQEGRHEEAVAAATAALDKRPAMPGALQLAIQAMSAGLRDPERAAVFARERAAKARDDAVMAYLVAQLEADLGRRDEALAVLRPLCEAELPLPAALSLRALLVLEKREFAEARALLTKSIETYADAPDLHYLLAQCGLADPANQKDGEPTEQACRFAVAELRAVVRVAKNHAPALNNLAWLLSREEATAAEALEYADAVVRLHPDYAPYLDTRGTVLTRLGRADQALASFRAALGACETERVALDKRASGKPSSAEAAKVETLRRRLDRTKAQAQGHFDEALKASSGR